MQPNYHCSQHAVPLLHLPARADHNQDVQVLRVHLRVEYNNMLGNGKQTDGTTNIREGGQKARKHKL
jgi:hypothetical protein